MHTSDVRPSVSSLSRPVGLVSTMNSFSMGWCSLTYVTCSLTIGLSSTYDEENERLFLNQNFQCCPVVTVPYLGVVLLVANGLAPLGRHYTCASCAGCVAKLGGHAGRAGHSSVADCVSAPVDSSLVCRHVDGLTAPNELGQRCFVQVAMASLSILTQHQRRQVQRLRGTCPVDLK